MIIKTAKNFLIIFAIRFLFHFFTLFSCLLFFYFSFPQLKKEYVKIYGVLFLNMLITFISLSWHSDHFEYKRLR